MAIFLFLGQILAPVSVIVIEQPYMSKTHPHPSPLVDDKVPR